MGYATREQLILRIGEVELIQHTDRDGLALGIVDEVLEAAQAAACGEIDGYLTDGGYAVPLASAPQRIVAADVALTRWYLAKDGRTEAIEKEAALYRDWLGRVAEGKVSLFLADLGSGAGEAMMDGGRNDFTGGGY